MGEAFQADSYLRGLGESLLAREFPNLTGLVQATGALVAAELIDAAAAQEVLDGYDEALAIQSGASPTPMISARARRRALPVAVPQVGEERIINCEHVIDRDRWTLVLKQVRLSEEETSLVCELQTDNGAGDVVEDRTGRPRSELLEIPVTDDRGTATVAWFNLKPEAAQGAQRHLRSALAIDTAWIEIDSERCELHESRPDVTVTVTPPDHHGPALRHLWHQVAIHNQYGTPIDLGPAVNALLASGAISRENATELPAVQAMLSAVQQRAWSALPGEPVPSSPDDPLPGPWSQMLARRGQNDGPTGEILISTVLPPIDGISVAIRTVKSSPSGFDITVECKPALGCLTRHEWEVGERLAWWAADDLGNRYLGQTRQWVSHDHAGREDDSHATITFWPSLDPAAARLEIIPTAESTQAVLGVGLPWARPHHN